MKDVKFKFREDELIEEFKNYILSTYDGHYSKDRQFQASEFIFDSGHGIGFTLGNVMKYAQRYGQKGTNSDHRKDLLKIIHYAFLALYVHDKNDIFVENVLTALQKVPEFYTNNKEFLDNLDLEKPQ